MIVWLFAYVDFWLWVLICVALKKWFCSGRWGCMFETPLKSWLHGALKAPCTSITATCTSLITQQKFKWFLLWQCYKSIIWAWIVPMSSEEQGLCPLLSCIENPDPFPAGSWAGKRKGVSSFWELLWHPLPPGKRREEFRQFLAKLFQGQSTYTPPGLFL